MILFPYHGGCFLQSHLVEHGLLRDLTLSGEFGHGKDFLWVIRLGHRKTQIGSAGENEEEEDKGRLTTVIVTVWFLQQSPRIWLNVSYISFFSSYGSDINISFHSQIGKDTVVRMVKYLTKVQTVLVCFYSVALIKHPNQKQLTEGLISTYRLEFIIDRR